MNANTNVKVSGLEAVADAIMSFEGWKPDSRSYRNRNPGNIESGPGQYAVYPSLVDGYAALLRELRSKFTGHNTHHIGPDSTLLDLFNVYAPASDNNPTPAYCNFVANWCTIVLGRPVNASTKLKDIWSGETT